MKAHMHTRLAYPYEHLQGTEPADLEIDEVAGDVLLVNKDLDYPFLALLISGGHNLLVLAQNLGEYVQLGTTIDDAIAEAYDKAARWLGLDIRKGGGPALEELALEGDPNSIDFTVLMRQHKDCNFSYAGLKTQVRLATEQCRPCPPKDKIFERVINPYLTEVLQHPQSIKMSEGMLHIRDFEGPKKTGSVETRLEAMEQQVFKCQGMVERGLNTNHMMIKEFTNNHKMDAIDIGKHLSNLYDRVDQLQGQIYDLQNQNSLASWIFVLIVHDAHVAVTTSLSAPEPRAPPTSQQVPPPGTPPRFQIFRRPSKVLALSRPAGPKHQQNRRWPSHPASSICSQEARSGRREGGAELVRTGAPCASDE
ncbi:putative O-sialoglycoprotein endopeptidase 2 [Hordeum vulgare]|nr:putative O-sialoglycoprotein endopeptidase 2 [Hordeum vulgare]